MVTAAAMAALLTMQEPAAQGLDTLPQRRRWAARLVYTDLRLLGEAAQEAILLHVHWGLLLSTLLLAQAVTAAVTPLLLLVQLLLLARRGRGCTPLLLLAPARGQTCAAWEPAV